LNFLAAVGQTLCTKILCHKASRETAKASLMNAHDEALHEIGPPQPQGKGSLRFLSQRAARTLAKCGVLPGGER